jgi:hypothetical protein
MNRITTYKLLILYFSLSLYTSHSNAQFKSEFELSNLNGKNGVIFNGFNSSELPRATNVGDINNDNIDDVFICIYNTIDSLGACYVIFGKDSEFQPIENLSDLDGSNGFVVNGLSNAPSMVGSNNSGDINNDGINDLLIGISQVSTNTGASYVIFGRDKTFPAVFDLSKMDGEDGFVLNGVNLREHSGSSVTISKDINGDSIDDLIIGAPFACQNSPIPPGKVYVVFGKSTPFPPIFELSSLNGTNGYVIQGDQKNKCLGIKVNALGDINGDGMGDIFLSDNNEFPGTTVTTSYIVFGSNQPFSNTFQLSNLNGTNGFKIEHVRNNINFIGASANTAGDFNNDGIDDFIIANPYTNVNGQRSGTVYIIYGSQHPWVSIFDLNTLNGNNGFVINGIDEFNGLGHFVNSIGDLNGDGIDDVAMSTIIFPNLFVPSTVGYVLFGSTQTFSMEFDVTTLDGDNGFKIKGASGQVASLLSSITSAGDLNADGIADLLLGGFGGDISINGVDSVVGYTIFGIEKSLFMDGFE